MSAVAEYLRRHEGEITDAWVQAVRERVPELKRLGRGMLIDHMPEVLDALARWVERDVEAAERGFETLAAGHALERLGLGVDLESLTAEYEVIRDVMMRELLKVPSTQEVREDLNHLGLGIDRAVHLAIHRYARAREVVRDRFVGILGHDLRNPLGAAQMAAATIAARADPRDRRLAETILRATGRMQRMIDEVIDFTRGQLGGGIPANPARCDLGEICKAAVDELLIAHPERTITFSSTGDLRGTWDRDRVFQAMSNLIGNAIEHGEDPIAVSVHPADDARAVVTSVENRGETIEPAAMATLFDPFRRASRGAHTGLGLGLYIVQQIALAHGGECSAESSGDRTRFTIRWPRVPVDEIPSRP